MSGRLDLPDKPRDEDRPDRPDLEDPALAAWREDLGAIERAVDAAALEGNVAEVVRLAETHAWHLERKP